MNFTPPDDPYYTGDINIQHNDDLLVICIQTTTKLNAEYLEKYSHLNNNPYLYQNILVNKHTGAIEQTYIGPYGL